MERSQYRFAEIEEKWNRKWEETGLYTVVEDSAKPKYYVLDMFPYPSGSGLHVGHPLGYVASDIYARFKRLNGFNVLHPMGFDAFGLPAEQYAIETGQHPSVTTEKNIAYFREQLGRMGLSYDWNRSVRTSDPEYYKWTQWIFMQLFSCWFNPVHAKAEFIETLDAILDVQGTVNFYQKGLCDSLLSAEEWKAFDYKGKENIRMQFRLAYLDHADVWWCSELGTVLANDEVKDGVSERGGYPVEKMKMRQWFLRITAYAQRLLDGLETVDFSASMKEMQRNWIGRSEGALIRFPFAGKDVSLEIFTTRPDTIYGATFMVMAPEHPLVEQITDPAYRMDVEEYIKYVKTRSERDRQAEVKKVTGQNTGAFVVHPFTGLNIPVYIAEYVLSGYGTGAIMAVPGNDDRDFAFAEKFDLPVVQVIDQSAFPEANREDKVGKLMQSDILNGKEVKDAIAFMLDLLEERKIGKRKVNFRMRDAGFSRQRYWGEPFPVIYTDDVVHLLQENELPVKLPETASFKPGGSGKSPLAALNDWMQYSGPSGSGERESDTMPGYAGSSWYFYRYMDVANTHAFAGKDKIEYWRNVDLYIGGTEHAVGHLLYSRMWNKFLYDLGYVVEDEPFKKLVNQGMIQGISRFVYRIQGTDTYVSKGLKDQYVTTEIRVHAQLVDNDILDIEGLKKWRADFADAEFILENGKYFCGSEVEKMSKTKHNVVNPDEVIAHYGADCFRLYEMFLGPLDASKPWDTKGITGVQGFLKKLWRLFYDENGVLRVTTNGNVDADSLKTVHKTIKKVGEDVEKLSFNTAVSASMICVNTLGNANCSERSVLEKLLVIIAPFAPYIAEELWEAIGNSGSVHAAEWPVYDPNLLIENTCTYPVSINGKTRTTVELPLDMPVEEIEKTVLALDAVVKWTEGKTPRKVIIVKGKIVNVVV